ncbi:MAG: glycosyltransferase [Cyanobacteria bacterium P01_A01_bin.17]
MISVGVFIDLKWQRSAGGHVKCWEKFAQAAVTQPDLDLSLHFLGDKAEVLPLSETVRYILHRPRFSTERLPFLQDVPDHTDLMSRNPALLPYLEAMDVAHTTHPLFTFGKTAQAFCQQRKKPLVASVHTDTPQYTQIYLEQRLQGIFGHSFVNQWLLDRWQLPLRYRRRMVAQQQDYWQTCDHVFISQPDDPEVQTVVPAHQVSYLRRGIDTERFNPERCDRNHLQKTYGIPTDKFLLLYVGRLDDPKRVMIFAQSAKILLDQGLPIHALAVGRGHRSRDIQALLGKQVTLPGTIEQEKLGTIFASADVFVFPSPTETVGNVILEAKAAGLPVVISSQGGAYQTLQKPGEDGLMMDTEKPEQWAQAIAQLYADGGMRSQISAAAQNHIKTAWPSWQDVLIEDLLPIWRSLADAPSP